MNTLEIRHGDVFLGEQHIIDGSGVLAIGYADVGDDIFMLIGFGEFERVSKKVEQYRKTLDGEFEIIGMPVHQDVIDYLNDIRKNNAQLARMKQFLLRFGEDHPEISYSQELQCFLRNTNVRQSGQYDNAPICS